MKTITFATGNVRKLKEAQLACGEFNIDVKQVQLEFDEIQAHDPRKITKHKIETAYKIHNGPITVNDSSWQIPALNKFPGGYMKDIAEWFEPEDFINLLRGKTNRSIVLVECIIYKDEEITKEFYREFVGEIAKKPRGKSGNSLEKIVIMNGKTISEHHDDGNMAFAAKDYIWYDFAKWYSNK